MLSGLVIMVNQSGPAAAFSAALPRLLLALCAASVLLISNTNAIGVNFGQVADNLPSDEVVLQLVQTTAIKKLKIYSADPGVLTTFAGSGIDIVIGAGNDQVQPIASTAGYAFTWVQTNIAAYPNTSIVGVALGNEILSYEPQLILYLLPALQNLQAALVSLGLDQKVKLSSPSSLGIVAKSFPPSYGEFHYDDGNDMSPILEFFAQTGSPFMVNVYPYFAYAAAPESISLDYVLFSPNAVPVYDVGSGLNYTNMFDAQVDAVYAAMSKLGYNNVSLAVTETGWPSAGDPTEAGASVANAQLFNANLVKHIESGVGTPAKPGVTVDTYIFALFNEDMKPGPTSERNFGLYNPDGTPVYDSGLTVSPQWYSPPPPPAVVTPPTPVGVSLPPSSFSPPPPVAALPPIENYWPPPPPDSVLPPVENYWPPPPVTVSPPVASYWPPPPPVPAVPPVTAWPSPPIGVAQPPPQGYPPPPIAAGPSAAWSPPGVAQPPPQGYPPPPIAAAPSAAWSPPGVAQPPPQGYPPPPIAGAPSAAWSPPGVAQPPPQGYPPPTIAAAPIAAWSPPPPIVIATPPGLGWSPPPPPVVISTPPAPGPAEWSPPSPSLPTAPVPTSPTVPIAPGPGAQSWCVAKADADPGQLQIALDWACSTGGADCSLLQLGGACFTPNTIVAHSSYAFDSYYQLNNRNYWDCFFSDTAEITNVNPSFVGCNFP